MNNKLQMKSCVECASHKVELDPDPFDWFCDDDVKVVCTTKNKVVTAGCRPYNIKRDAIVPKWCPRKKS
jgi:hypothetical protein